MKTIILLATILLFSTTTFAQRTAPPSEAGETRAWAIEQTKKELEEKSLKLETKTFGATDVHLKSGKVWQATSASTTGEELILQIKAGEIEFTWDELTEVDSRKCFPAIWAEIDRLAKEKEASRVTVRLKSGIGYTADSVTVKDKTLIIRRYKLPDVDFKWDELVEADARKFFPAIYADVDKEAKARKELWEAIRDGDVNKVRDILESFPSINQTKWASSPLHEAAKHSHTAIVRLLISNKFDVNATNEYRMTPLHVAAINAAADVAEVLISNGADVNAEDKRGKTPLYWAEFSGRNRTPSSLAEQLTWEHNGGAPIDEAYLQVIMVLRRHGAR